MEKKNQVPKYPLLRFPEFTDEWKEVKLGEVAEISKGSGISKDQLSPHGLPCILYGELYTKYSSELISEIISHTELDPLTLIFSKAEDVIIPSSGETAIDIAVARCVPIAGVAIGGDLNIIRSEDTDGVFLAYQLNGIRKKGIAKMAQGSSIVHLYGHSLSKLAIAYPSLPEQRKIAALLGLIDERIEVQNAIIKEQEAQKAALLRHLFDRSLRFPEFTDEWKKVKLGEVGKMYNGLSGKKAADFGAGYPFITYKMVFDSGVIDMSKVSYVEIGPGEKQNKVREGDIFFTTSSETIDEVGMSSVLLRDADNLFLNSFCFGYRLNTPNLTTSQYLGYMLRGPQMRMRISSLGQGITRFNISKEKVSDLQIAVSSLAEQKKIAGLLSAIDERIAVEKEYATLLQKQKAYLLRQMFV